MFAMRRTPIQGVSLQLLPLDALRECGRDTVTIRAPNKAATCRVIGPVTTVLV